MSPENQNVREVSRETGVNYQTIKNRIKQYGTDTFDEVNTESYPRFLTVKKKYQLLLDVASLKEDDRGGFLRERGIHLEHLVIWDQEPGEMIDKEPDSKNQELKALRKKNKEHEKDFQRKGKTLAEAAALLVLKKLDVPAKEHEND